MRTLLATLLTFLVTLVFVSCQREVEADIPNPPGPSTPVESAFSLVEYDESSSDLDSAIRIIKRTSVNGQRATIVKDVWSDDPTDTIITTFSYDADGHPMTIKSVWSSAPSVVFNEYVLTWTNGKLMKIAAAEGTDVSSIELTYTPQGANTMITLKITPDPNAGQTNPIYINKHSAIVNSQLQLISEQYINKTVFANGSFNSALPGVSHDTANIEYTYNGDNLTSSISRYISRDTNISSSIGANYTNITSSTVNFTYNRHTQGSNIADSLAVIYSPDLYKLMNILYLQGYFMPVINIHEDGQYFFRYPLISETMSGQTIFNGVPEPAYNITEPKIPTASFDSQGRLTKADIRWPSGGAPEYTLYIKY